MSNPPPLGQAELDKYFPRQRSQPIKPGAFEVGLCLGGTVSAGAYTGGVLDFVIEALDAWTLAKEHGLAAAPPHEVVISTIAGASGGAINGGILLRAAGWEFAHGSDAGNPFYSAWTTGVDLMKLLASNPSEKDLASVFNCKAIDDQAADTIKYQGQPLGSNTSPRHRSYLADPLRLMMMVGNITGLPYSIKMAGQSRLTHDLVAHADYMRFGLTVDGGMPADPASRPDELALSSNSPLNWEMVANAATATSAFPLAFRSRQLSRALAQCGYRAVAIPGEAGPGSGEVIQLLPDWEKLKRGEPDPATSNFVNVDGGTINNEPLDMVRIALAGLDGRNKRGAKEVDRAVVLIDPFSDPEELGPREPPALTALLLPFVLSLVYQARYKPTDIALAYKEDAFSRYLIAPVGPGPDGKGAIGRAAIASGGLGGFLGFVDSSFLQYDYALGRLNAYSFLKRHLALLEDAGNPIFDRWGDPLRNQYRFVENGIKYLPLIPLMSTVKEPDLPRWPMINDVPAGLSNAINVRLDTVYGLATTQTAPDTWWKRALMSSYLWLGWRFYLRGALRDFALNTIRQGLIEQKLMPGKPSS